MPLCLVLPKWLPNGIVWQFSWREEIGLWLARRASADLSIFPEINPSSVNPPVRVGTLNLVTR
jgi:hypothetical protein